MQTLLFFDDWLLESTTDIVRRWHAAEPVPWTETATLPARATVVYDPARRRFLAWSKPVGGTRAALHESADGLRWQPAGAEWAVFENVNFPFEATASRDPFDRDAARRFKMPLFPYRRGIFGGAGVLAWSADGRRWTVDRRARWFSRKNGSDTIHPLFFNPVARRWCIVCRPWCADRRVALAESADLRRWSEPFVILHPDAGDPPGLQFYGMAPTLYARDYFVGAVQACRPPLHEPFAAPRRYKVQGAVDGQLIYSYDGRLWLRSDRSALVPRAAPGRPGGGCVYPHAVIPHPDPRQGIYIYSLGAFADHGAFADPDAVKGPPPGYAAAEYALVHRLRRDGFVSLEPAGGSGTVTTRALIPRRPALALNVQAPVGRVRVQVADLANRPLPGYRFEDCLPLRGDDLAAPVRWKRKPDLAGLVGQAVRLQIRLLDARLFAVHADCGLAYAYTVKPLARIP